MCPDFKTAGLRTGSARLANRTGNITDFNLKSRARSFLTAIEISLRVGYKSLEWMSQARPKQASPLNDSISSMPRVRIAASSLHLYSAFGITSGTTVAVSIYASFPRLAYGPTYQRSPYRFTSRMLPSALPHDPEPSRWPA
jgi:hypothetical protein